jgi:hypothetical protein
MNRIFTVFLLFIFVIWSGCNQDPPENPFDNVDNTQDTVRLEITPPDSATIAGLYVNVFKPTCANVGCHDGNFEPDYRTLESTYNTMVYQAPVKNDGNYEYRVKPGDINKSVLMARLEGQITPLMPFQLEPDSDWGAKRETYLAQIRKWINDGAPDMMGVLPGLAHPTPRLLGARGMRGGVWLPRTGGTGPLQISDPAQTISLYLAFGHDEINPNLFTHNKIAFSTHANEFDQAQQYNLEIIDTPVIERGFDGSMVSFTHKVDIIPAQIFPGISHIFFRAYVQDQHNPVTEIPTENGIFYIKNYMSYRIQ